MKQRNSQGNISLPLAMIDKKQEQDKIKTGCHLTVRFLCIMSNNDFTYLNVLPHKCDLLSYKIINITFILYGPKII